MAVVLLTLVLLAVVIAVVSRPLFVEHTQSERDRADGGAPESAREAHIASEGAGPHSESETRRREELEAAREAKYREIRDAELDYRTGKLSTEDYEAVNAALRAEGVEILDRLEALEERMRASDEEDRPALEGPAGSSTRVS